MNRFAALLDRLSYEPRRNGKLALIADYLRETPDPARGYGLAALAGDLSFRHAKPSVIRALIEERVDPVLFAMSYDYVGDLSETVALVWPANTRPVSDNQEVSGNDQAASRDDQQKTGHDQGDLKLDEVVGMLEAAGRAELPGLVAKVLDRLDETGRWAFLKLITGALRVGVSARLAKTAVAALGQLSPGDIEEVWHGLKPPYEALFAWAEGKTERPDFHDPAPFRPPMLSHALEPADLETLDPDEFAAEWKWDGIRVQAVAATQSTDQAVRRLFSRTGEDISGAFPDLVEALKFDGAIDGELLILRDNRVQSFNTLQQRLNRKTVTAKMLDEFPAHLIAYDLLFHAGEDLREQAFAERRRHLEALVTSLASSRVSLSPLVAFTDWDALTAARAEPAAHGAGENAGAVEGVMVKRIASPYLAGRPKGHWWKWKRDPFNVDAVLMYAQRGHGKRSSYYSDYTFGVWREGPDGAELVPVGKAYFGFTDEELRRLDRFVRQQTINRFGPVREVVHDHDAGLVLEIAFEGLARSTRHKSGLAMRFPRIGRIRWDKRPADADRIEQLEALLQGD